MSLAKITFFKSVEVRRYGICGCVAACYIKSMVVCVCVCDVCCAEFHSAQHTAHTLLILMMLNVFYYASYYICLC